MSVRIVYLLFLLLGAPPSERASDGPQPVDAGLRTSGNHDLRIEGPGPEERGAPMALSITSRVFEHERPIPRRFTCDGEDVSPPLAWTGIPKNAKSLVLVVDDPDAPDPRAPKMTWVHWVLYNIPPDATGLAEAVSELPEGTLEGVNDWKRTGYGGPCPPIGRHRYYHKLYALDTVLPNLDEPTKADLEKAMSGHVLEQAVIMGTYQR